MKTLLRNVLVKQNMMSFFLTVLNGLYVFWSKGILTFKTILIGCLQVEHVCFLSRHSPKALTKLAWTADPKTCFASSNIYRWHQVLETEPNTCLFSNQSCGIRLQ